MKAQPEFRVYRSVWFDNSTRGADYIRHDSWRGDVRTYQLIGDRYHQIARVRKRFPNKDDAMRWAEGETYNLREHYRGKCGN
ncbi:hypothetical protein F9874_10060 [Glaesserella parasuis]|uniref:hypothetical protein n=1 Tax=Glaesserella parasuis TaxID=738 RepID=UPI001321EAB6|nr:hypothetical protein [Glaesserella parasuis]MDP0268870.1 hypothetical protein [Glaesserella parasuis]MDP0295164.1 hypothetical protein [Glaesserella parasuis]MWQ00605.1 hypothetical protein [Glaesserella parasuis]MWQ13311.1 hypothetical protein [Glaesserella parasuis]MWQ39589.1 hypothetical protein [Glaesserella parasuis]